MPSGLGRALALDAQDGRARRRAWASPSTSSWWATPGASVAGRDREQSPGFVLDLVQAANGAGRRPPRPDARLLLPGRRPPPAEVRLPRGAPRGPEEDRAGREAHRRPAARRASSCGSSATSSSRSCSSSSSLLGLLVRSFPGPGDLEILELARRPARARGGRPHPPRARRHLVGAGAEPRRRRPRRRRDLHPPRGRARAHRRRPRHRPASTRATRRSCPSASTSCAAPSRRRPTPGRREDKIHALNLDYAARGLDPQEAERILTRPAAERAAAPRGGLRPGQGAPRLRRGPAPPAARAPRAGRDLREGRGRGASSRPGPRCASAATASSCARSRRGGRKDARLVLYYDRVPLAPRAQDASCPTSSSAPSASGAAASGSSADAA